MASLSGVGGSSYVSSLYNSSNIISGLASGMDTESMIENLTKSYQTKITQLQQKQTKLGWKQDAYRSIINKMNSYSNKYTSFTSSTNLMSQSFWSSARTSSVQGEFASKVSASGTTTSDVILKSVERLAASARYVTSGNFNAGDGTTITADEGVDLQGETEVNGLQGSISLTYGSKHVSVVFSESDKIVAQKKENGELETQNEALARVINEKLEKETLTLSGGSSLKASERIQAVADGDSITFKPVEVNDKGEDKAGNTIYISGGSGSFKGAAPEKPSEAKEDTFTVPKSYDQYTVEDEENGETRYFRTHVPNVDKISGKTFNINLDGRTKQVKGPLITEEGDKFRIGGEKDKNGNITGGVLVDKTDKAGMNKAYVSELNKAIQKEFGNKIKVSDVNAGKDTMQLKFEVPEDSDILINTDAGDALNIGKSASNYLNTSKTLGDLGVDFEGLTPSKDKDGKEIEGMYDLTINGKVVGSYGKDTTLSAILSDINSKSDVKVNYSKTSREFVFTTKDTGEHTTVDLGGLAEKLFGTDLDQTKKIKDVLGDDLEGDLKGKSMSLEIDGKSYTYTFKADTGNLENLKNGLNKLLKEDGYEASFNQNGTLSVKDKNGQDVAFSFGKDDQVGSKLVKNLQTEQGYTSGQDSRFTVSVNGTEKTLSRSGNSAEIDGLTINFKGTFNQDYASKTPAEKAEVEGVTFQSEVNADKVVDEVKNMIAELNVMLSEVRGQYSTMPARTSGGSIKEYEPLTDEDKAGMSESAIKNYEEKAKQGLLFADPNLSGLYNNIVNTFNRMGEDRTMMDKMGIGISYDTNGAATITFDESKFRDAMESDYDGVVDIFTRTKDNGAESDGLMQGIKTQMDRYGSTTGVVKGILVQQAGTPLASLTLLDNGWQKEIDNYSGQISKWQDKLESQVDRYTKMFTRLEMLTNQMNSQSSALASLMGGG